MFLSFHCVFKFFKNGQGKFAFVSFLSNLRLKFINFMYDKNDKNFPSIPVARFHYRYPEITKPKGKKLSYHFNASDRDWYYF